MTITKKSSYDDVVSAARSIVATGLEAKFELGRLISIVWEQGAPFSKIATDLEISYDQATTYARTYSYWGKVRIPFTIRWGHYTAPIKFGRSWTSDEHEQFRGKMLDAGNKLRGHARYDDAVVAIRARQADTQARFGFDRKQVTTQTTTTTPNRLATSTMPAHVRSDVDNFTATIRAAVEATDRLHNNLSHTQRRTVRDNVWKLLVVLSAADPRFIPTAVNTRLTDAITSDAS